MNTSILRNWAVVALRLFLAAVFAYAAFDKILHPAAFAETVGNYRLVPPPLLNLVALWLPWLEMVIAVQLLTGFRSRDAAWWATLLIVMFLLGMGQALARGIDLNCGCFTQGGVATTPVGPYTIARDFVFLFASIALVVLDRKAWTWSLFCFRPLSCVSTRSP